MHFHDCLVFYRCVDILNVSCFPDHQTWMRERQCEPSRKLRERRTDGGRNRSSWLVHGVNHLYLYKNQNVCVLAFFSAISKLIGIPFGTKLLYGPGKVLKLISKKHFFLQSYCPFGNRSENRLAKEVEI